MKGFIKGIMSLAASLLLASCTYRDLKAVERAMETDPAVADSLLSEIPIPAHGRSQALYALLKTQIDYKMYRDADSDSLVRIATDYYGRKYKGYHAAMAWYSLGCISAELGNDSTAADAYLSALSLFPDTLVRYYALAEQNLSYIFLEHNMDDEAIQLIKSCRFNACRLADSAAIAFCDYNIAKYYLYNNKYDEAQTLFLELKDNKWLSPTTEFEPLLQLSKIELFKNNNYDKALRYIDLYILNNHCTPLGAAYTTKANIFKSMNQLDSAFVYYNLSLKETDDPYTRCDAFRRLSTLYSNTGNSRMASFCAEQASSWMDSIVVNNQSDIIFRALLSNSNNYFPRKYSFTTKSVALLITSLLLILIGILLHFRALSGYGKKNEHTQHVKAISDFENDLIDFKRNQVYNEMIFAINERKEIESKRKNELTDKFRNSLPELRAFIAASSHVNDKELDYCIFTMLGFKQKDYHRIFNLSQSGCRNLKTRIKGKMPDDIYNYIFESQDFSCLNVEN